MSSCSTLECLKNIHVSTLIAAQDTIVVTAPSTVWGVPFNERKSESQSSYQGSLCASYSAYMGHRDASRRPHLLVIQLPL